MRDRFTLLEKTFRKKIRDEEKGSGISPPELTENEIAIQEIIEKTDEAALHFNENSDNAKQDADKKKAEEMRKMSMETYCETRKRSSSIDDDESPKSKRSRGSGSETVAFLKSKAEQDAELRQVELKLKKDEIDVQRQQQRALADIINQMANQQKTTQQQQHQMMLAQMQGQQQQNQLFAALIEKLSK